MYPLIGASVLAVWLINPSEVKGVGAFLIIVGAVVWSFEAGLDYNGGYGLAVILAGWGALRLVASLRIRRGGAADGQRSTASTTALSS